MCVHMCMCVIILQCVCAVVCIRGRGVRACMYVCESSSLPVSLSVLRELLDASLAPEIDYFNIKVLNWKKLDTKQFEIKYIARR